MVFESVPINKAYRLLHPKLVVLVTTIDKNDQPNVAPIAWTMPLTHNEAYVGISVSKSHKTHANIVATGEFVLNFPEINLAKAVIACASKDSDKFQKANLTKTDSKNVRPPKIIECYAHIECCLKDKVDIDDHTLFIGECIYADIKRDGFDKFKLAVDKIHPLYHVGEKTFVSLDITTTEV